MNASYPDSFVDISSNNVTYENCSGNFSDGHSSLWDVGPGGISSDLSGLVVVVTRMLTGVIASIGILLNCLVFSATRKGCSKKLKSKAFILNSIASDISLIVGTLGAILVNILVALGLKSTGAHIADIIISVIGSTTQFAQVFALVLLAVDRTYAVVKPMTYHTVGYSTLAKVLMIASSWTRALALVLPTFIIPFAGDRYSKLPVHAQLRQAFIQFTSYARGYVSIGVHVFVFLIYVIIFVVLFLKRRRNPAVEASTTPKASLSLTMTYFCIHISTLCLYAPGPVFIIFSRSIPSSEMSATTKAIVNRFFVQIYLFNTVVNAVILGTRVRLIRQHVQEILNSKKSAK